MNNLMVIDNATGERRIMALAEAAALAHIEVEDIERSIAQLRVCQSIDFVILDTEPADDVPAP